MMGGGPPGMMGGGPPGMMGGPGGMMGGPGGPRGPPPKPKAVPLSQARKALDKVMKALSSPEARQKVQGAIQQLSSQPPPKDPKMKTQQRMMTLVPIMNEVCGSILQKYGWKGGFMEMVASIGEHAKADTTIGRDLEPLRMLMMGEHPLAGKGNLQEFDALAKSFGEKDEAGKAEIIAQTKKRIEELTVDGKLKKPLAKYYLKTMERVVEKGQEYVETEAKRLMAKLKTDAGKDKRGLKMVKLVNILGSFVTKADMQKMQAEHQKNMPKKDL